MSNSIPLELRQNYLSERREFVLEPKRVRLFVKDFNGETEAFVSYEKITTTTRTVTQQDGRLYIISISFGVFALIGFILYFAGISILMRWAPLWGIAFVVLFAFHLYKKRRYLLIDLTDGKSILFLANQPSKDELERFINLIYEARKKYYLDKYYALDLTNDPNDEIAKFQWLLKEEFITESEYQAMRIAIITHVKNQSADFQNKGVIN